MLCYNRRGNNHTFCCPRCGNKIDKKVLQNSRLKRDGEKLRICSTCGEKIYDNAGKCPQIVVSVVGSKKCDTKGFIASAIFKICEFDKNLLIESVSETSSLKCGITRSSFFGDETSDAGEWDFDKIKNAYKHFFEDEHAQYPTFESEDPYDRAYIQSYTFKVVNKGNKKNALLTIVEINERFLYGYRHINQMRMMPEVLTHINSILRNSGYVFYLIDPDDVKEQDLSRNVAALRWLGKDALHAIICQNKPEKVNMSRDEFEATNMEKLLRENRKFVIDKLNLRDGSNLYFICSPEEHSDNDETGNSLNCELPFYWILILEGIMDVFLSERNTIEKYNRIRSEKKCWKRVEEKLYFSLNNSPAIR